MPIADAARIAQVPGVRAVAPRAIFLGSFQQPRNAIRALATQPARWFAVWPEYAIPREQLDALLARRDGIAVTAALQKQYGWKLGDQIPLNSRILKKDGSTDWAFTLVGVFDNSNNPGQSAFAMMNYGYFDEARALNRGTADRFIVRIDDPKRSIQTAAAIDALFANSAHETRTQSEQEQAQSLLKQVGDLNFFASAIVAAVFFTLLFLTTNTMLQSARERIPEFAVLKAFGYSDRGVLLLVLFESLVLCLAAAVTGLTLAATAFPRLTAVFGGFQLPPSVLLAGVAAACGTALISALVPAWRVKRLRVAEAIAGQPR
jgi:putative ABC transport system permease protein